MSEEVSEYYKEALARSEGMLADVLAGIHPEGGNLLAISTDCYFSPIRQKLSDLSCRFTALEFDLGDEDNFFNPGIAISDDPQKLLAVKASLDDAIPTALKLADQAFFSLSDGSQFPSNRLGVEQLFRSLSGLDMRLVSVRIPNSILDKTVADRMGQYFNYTCPGGGPATFKLR